MTSVDYKTIFASVRPSRVAVLMDESDPDWRDTSVRVVEFFTTLWGGKHNIIVPTDGKTIADCFWDILETFDPDYLFTYRKTLGDLKLSNPEKYAEIVEREATQFISKNPGADREAVCKEIDRALEHTPVSRFGISPELEQLLKERLAPFWFQQHVVEPGGITAGSIGHFPLTTISKLIPYCKPVKHIARLDVSAPHIPPVWYAPTTGSIHRAFAKELESSGVTEFTVKIAEKQVRELFDVVIKGRIDESRSQFRAELGGSGEAPLKDFSEQTPFGLSMTNVSSYRSAKYQDWLEPLVVVAGDTFADFCLYYGLSRLRDKVAWVLPEWVTVFGEALARARAGGEKIKEEEMLVYYLVHVLTEVIHYGTAQNRILLLSRSLDRAHLEQMRDTLDGAMLSSPGTFKSSCDVGEFMIELLRSPLVAYETDNVERDYTKQLLGNKLAGRFDTPNRKISAPFTPRNIAGSQNSTLGSMGFRAILRLARSLCESRASELMALAAAVMAWRTSVRILVISPVGVTLTES